ncbi:hypothetical protein [Nocardia sp. NPDC020380]|uniref:hypothetical protein n=1 Tax=Nocardia sp. NPDC020380 TaxID=3364309 RepID=UPI003792939F
MTIRVRARWALPRRIVCAASVLMVAVGVSACSSAATAEHPAEHPALDAARAGDTIPLPLLMSHWISWRSWHGTRLPFADRWGPTQVTDDAATGFSHTPEGAVVAMMQHQARLAGIGDSSWQAAAERMAVVAPADRPPTRRIPTGFDSSADLPYFAGIRWLSYTGDRATADLALQTPAGALSSVPVTEVWIGSDWKAELPAAGAASSPLDSFDGYQPWPGVPR